LKKNNLKEKFIRHLITLRERDRRGKRRERKGDRWKSEQGKESEAGQWTLSPQRERQSPL
jgi:hypothetical protein